MEEKTYRTGEVRLPKNYRPALTALLLSTLFLGCLISALGYANIRLSLLLEQQDRTLLSFVSQPQTAARGEGFPALGITGCCLTELEQEYFALPAGVYVIETDHPMLRTGDVVTGINGSPFSGDEDLERILSALDPSQKITLQIRRGNETLSVTHIPNPAGQ